MTITLGGLSISASADLTALLICVLGGIAVVALLCGFALLDALLERGKK